MPQFRFGDGETPHYVTLGTPHRSAAGHVDDAVLVLHGTGGAPELGIIDREIGKVKHGRFVLLPITESTRGHGTHTHAEIWQSYLRELLTTTGAR